MTNNVTSIRHLRPVENTHQKYTEWAPEFERAIVYACAHYSRFWGLIGTHIDVDALRDSRGAEIVKACGAIARETGEGPTSPILVLRRLQQRVVSGAMTSDDLDRIATLFDEVEDGAALPTIEQLATEAAHTLKARRREAIMSEMTLATSKGKSLARYAAQIEAAEKIGRESTTGSVKLGSHVWAGIDALKRSSKLPLGITQLDDTLGGGIVPKTLTTIGADQGVGKTALMVQIAMSNFLAGKRVIFMPTEESVPMTLVRAISWITGLQMEEVGHTSEEAKRKLDAVLAMPSIGAFAVEYVPQGTPVAALRQIIERVLEEHPEFGGGFDLAVIDYGDKLAGNGRERNKYEEYGTVWEGLRQLAVDYGNWVVTGSQLKDREGKKRPKATDLRDSRKKGDVSDAVIIIERPEDNPEDREYVIAKHRGPGPGQVVGPIPTQLDIGRIAPCPAHEMLTQTSQGDDLPW